MIPKKDGDRAAVFFLVFLLAISMLLHAIRSASSYSYFVHYEAHQEKTSRQHCQSKLSPFGYDYKSATNNGSSGGQPEKKDLDNLCQQIRAAEAAEWSAEYAAGQYFVSKWSLVLVLFATIAAGAAACYTRRQAHIAETALIILERPYITVIPWQMALYSFWEDAGNIPRVRLEVRNYGKTPALIEKVAAHLIVANSDAFPVRSVLVPNHSVDLGAVLANRDDVRNYTLTVENFDPNRTFEELGTGSVYLVAGEIWYADFSGTLYAHPFEFIYNRAQGRFDRRDPTNRSFASGRIPKDRRGE